MADDFDYCRCPHAPISRSIIAQAAATLRRGSFLRLALGAAFAPLLFPARARAAEAVTILRAARLFDGQSMRSPGVVVVKGDRIVSMTAGDAGSGAATTDLGDATLMPGLIDCHTHLSARVSTSYYLDGFGPPGESSPSIAEAAILSIKNAAVVLRNGFTTVRDVGGSSGIDLALRDAITGGDIIGPRMLVAGLPLSITGGHGDANDVPQDVIINRPTGIAWGPYGFREVVRENVKNHVDLIKILATGGVLSYGDTWNIPQMNLDEIQASVDEAHKFGRKITAHCHGDPGIAVAVNGGCDSIEHCTGVGETTLKKMKDRGVYLVPTIWALDSINQPGNPNHIPENSLAKARRITTVRNEGIQRAFAEGVKFAYGTDAGVFPHKENNKDFAALRKLGMDANDLLRSATSVAADNIGVTDRGKIAAGMLADIIAVKGDPRTTIETLERPSFVMVGGKVV